MKTFVTSTSGTRVQGLDAVRGLAIALVLLAHAFPSRFEGAGIVGVIVFFTLSGYLITGILTTDLARSGRIQMSRFYRNRALRLLPALVAMLIIFGLVEVLTNRLGDKTHLGRALALGLGYITDVPRFNRSVGPGLKHLWTLAVEEQFYVIWPILLLVAFRTRLFGPLFVVSGFSLALAATTSAALAAQPDYVYVLPTSWASTLVIGAAAMVYRDSLSNWLTRRRSGWSAAIGLLVITTAALNNRDGNSLWFYAVGGPLIAICAVAVIQKAVQFTNCRQLRPSSVLGRISYAVYLWNLPIVMWLAPGHDPSFLVGVLSIVLTLIAASMSWMLIENHVLRIKRRLDGRREERAIRDLTMPLDATQP
jgi:peptidoglycan/LPS O-acetylase OafA/YrhL